MENYTVVMYISTGFWTEPKLYKIREGIMEQYDNNLEEIFFADNYKDLVEEVYNGFVGKREYNQSESLVSTLLIDRVFITE